MGMFKKVPDFIRTLYALILLISILTLAVYFTKHAKYDQFKTKKLIEFHKKVLDSKDKTDIENNK
jgi:hypothetical protein